MNGTGIEHQRIDEHVFSCDVTDDHLEAAAGMEGKSAGVTHIACTSLPECPG